MANVHTVVRRVVRDVLDRCSSQGVVISETLAAFMVKAVVLDPKSTFSTDAELTPEDVASLANACVDRLMDTNSVPLQTMTMQTYMEANFLTRDEVILAYKKNLAASLEDIHREITDNHARTRDDLEALYRKLIFAVMTMIRLGSVTDSVVVRESTAAFESVLPPVELGSFVALDRQKKLSQLQELSGVVCGIRLYNKYTKKGGNMIPDLVQELSDSTKEVLKQLDLEYRNVCSHTQQCTAWLLANNPSHVHFQKMQEIQRNAFQYLVYLEILLEESCCSAPAIRKCSALVKSRIDSIGSTIQSKTAVPTSVIYPQFVELASHWQTLQLEQQCVISIITHISRLTPHVQLSKIPFEVQEALETLEIPLPARNVFDAMMRAYHQGVCLALNDPVAQEAIPPPASAPLVASDVQSCELLSPTTTHGFETLPLLIGGFCPVTITKQGTLVPVDRSIGLIRYNGGTYGFLTPDAARVFASSVEQILEDVMVVGRSAPELIDLLDLHAAVAAGSLKNVSDAFVGAAASIKCDGGTQTELHPIDTNIVKDYDWNEWALRRKAIHLTNLRTKKTHSTQTNQSNFRRENATQVFLPKTEATQTKTDASTSVPTPTTFIRGLRGETKSKAVPVQIVDLTLGVGGVSLTPKPKGK